MTYLTIASPLIPSARQSVRELATLERFLKDAPSLMEIDGFRDVPVNREGDNIDAAVAAWQRMRTEFAGSYLEPGKVFMLGQMEDAGWEKLPTFRFLAGCDLPSAARVMQLKSGNSAATLDAVSLAAAEIGARPQLAVGLVAAEKVNSRFVRRRVGSQIMGDASIAALLSSRPLGEALPTFRLLGDPVARTDARFFELRPDGHLGDDDFLDSVRRLTQEAVGTALLGAGITPGDVGYCCSQNLSERMFQHIGAERPLPGKLIRYREQMAHAPCVDLLANLSMAWRDGTLTRSSIVVALAFGIGIGVAAAVFHVE